MKLLNKIKHIFDKKTYEFQIYINEKETILIHGLKKNCLLYTSPSPRDS